MSQTDGFLNTQFRIYAEISVSEKQTFPERALRTTNQGSLDREIPASPAGFSGYSLWNIIDRKRDVSVTLKRDRSDPYVVMTQLSDKDKAPLFILGAGFNYDAKELAGPMPVIGHPIAYPLVADLWDLFPLDESRAKSSIEGRFQQAIDEHDPKPLRELSQRLFFADHYIASALRSTGKKPNTAMRLSSEIFQARHS